MLNKFNQIVATSALVFLMSCGGGNKILIPQSDISAAQKNGNLSALYEKANKMVDENRGSKKEEALKIRSQIANLLIKDKQQMVDGILEKHNADLNSVTRNDLNNALSNITDVKNWSATSYTLLKSKIDIALNKTNATINEKKQRAKASENSVDKVKLYKEASKLAGENQPEIEEYKNLLNKTLEQFSTQGSDAFEKRSYQAAIDSATAGLLLDPGNIQFESLLSQSKSKLFETEFRSAIESGKPESAYQSVLNIADQPSLFLPIKKSMNRSIMLLANYFAGSAEKAYKSGDYLNAFSNFNKARTIQQKMDVSNLGFVQEKKFLDGVMKKTKQKNIGLGYKYTLMDLVSEFDSNYPGLEAQKLKIKEDLHNRAKTKLSIADFKEVASSNSVLNSVGRRVASKLEKDLFDKLGNELSIVDNTQVSTGNLYDGLALKISGDILQSAIEKSSSQGRRNQSVVVEINRVETEEYIKWKEKKKGEAPVQYTETPVKQDIQLFVEHVQKLAIAEVAFRVVDPKDGKILLTDNIVKEDQFKGETINEFQKGLFHQPFVKANLPSDIKIMDKLSSDLALVLSEKLVSYLKEPEIVFYHKAKDNLSKGKLADSVELFANAIAIAEQKNKNVDDWKVEARNVALSF